MPCTILCDSEHDINDNNKLSISNKTKITLFS